MKTKIKLLLLFVVLSALGFSQSNKTERFTTGIYLEPQHYLSTNIDALIYWSKADGVNVGGHIELQGKVLYVRGRMFFFPELNGMDYLDADGGIGVNWRSRNDQSRIYAGVFIGAINRDFLGWGNGKTGIEVGYDFYLDNGFYFGVKLDNQYKHDDKTWRHNASGHSVNSAGIVLGYSWYWSRK